MGYRLVVLDLDGTTVEDGHIPSRRVRKAVRAAQDHGVAVAVATGRAYPSALVFAQALDIQVPLICCQGAIVQEPRGEQRVLFSQTVPADDLQDVAVFSEQQGLELSLYAPDRIYVTTMRYPMEFYNLWFGLPVEAVPGWREAFPALVSEGIPFVKGIILGEPLQQDCLLPELVDRFGGRLSVFRSHDYFVEVTAPGVSKGNALAFLAARLGITREETIAVGDAGNDVSMLRWAGCGIAMGNASPEVLAVADWVAPRVDQDGVADVIERFIIDGPGARSG